MKTVLAIDPGTTESAVLQWDAQTETVIGHDFLENGKLLSELANLSADADAVVIEGVASYGMPVGAEVFQTCIWIGRFFQRCDDNARTPTILFRLAVKTHLCHSAKAKDGNVRQALIDRFGHPGTKKKPGKLYGVSGHSWAALALAVTFSDTTNPP